MSEPQNSEKTPVKAGGEVSPTKGAETNPPVAGGAPAAGQLSKEEQWARFEEELKETDWGHQPC